jgi:hypothetical protein
MQKNICCLCKKEMREDEGNNANPLSNQKCCDECYKKRVIPARVRSLQKLDKQHHEEE